MVSQAFSASANVLKGDPPTLMAGLLKLIGRQEATKPGCPWRPGPFRLSLLITNEKSRSVALHISSSSDAGATRLKFRAITLPSRPRSAFRFDLSASCRRRGFELFSRLIVPGREKYAVRTRQRNLLGSRLWFASGAKPYHPRRDRRPDKTRSRPSAVEQQSAYGREYPTGLADSRVMPCLKKVTRLASRLCPRPQERGR